MATTQVKRRRGTEAQCDAMTPAEAEIIVDTTNDRLRLGDGSAAGGIEIPNAYDVQKGTFNTVNATGTDTLTVTLDPVPVSYTTNMTIHFKAAATNTGAVTLNVNGLGAKNIYKASGGSLGALTAGDLTIGAFYTVRYDGTQFVLEGSSGGVTSVSGTGGITVSPTTGAVVAGINTNNSLGVGAYAFLYYSSASALTNGSTTSGSNLYPLTIKYASPFSSGGFDLGSALTGTWRNVSGSTLQVSSNANSGLFIRTA